ncbi:MAG: tetratricopeptide repeat protein [Planctomycetes bacterium]|nr:tetratricopeptide repeat protein [Planctomycetota bacterium]
MRSKVISRICLILAGFILLGAVAQLYAEDSEERRQYRWYSTIRDGNYYLYKGKHDKALAAFEKALSLSVSEEEKADTLLRMAKSYEGAFKRKEAVATWKRIVEECPSSGHLPYVCARLAELHRSITLVSPKATEAEEREVSKKMTNDTAIYWFEKAVQSGPPYAPYVLSAKLYLAGIYPEVGRKDEAQQILEEISTIDIYDVKKPAYVGPFKEMNDDRITMSERLDETRSRLLSRRKSARRRLVETCVVWSDPVKSIVNLQKLVDKYPDTEIAKMAREKIEVLSEQLGLKTATDDLIDLPELEDAE